MLVETLFGGIGALVVLVLVFGSFLALMPLVVAAASILTTFLIVWGLTGVTDVSFIVQYLLALIGLGVAIDYALLIVTRWREERGARRGATPQRSSGRWPRPGARCCSPGITVAVSLAALIALPVPFLRSVGFTGLLIPLISVVAALTLLPALLLDRRARGWPGRNRRTQPTRRAGCGAASAAAVVAPPLDRDRGGIAGRAARARRRRCSACVSGTPPTTRSPRPAARPRRRSPGSSAAGIGAGLTQPVEILTTAARPGRARRSRGIHGVARRHRPGRLDAGRAWRSSTPGPAPTRPARPAHGGRRRGPRRRGGGTARGSAASRRRTPTSSPPSTATPGGSR